MTLGKVSTKRALPLLVLIAGMALAVAVYWVGLKGPFLFDDGPNFLIIKDWFAGKAGLDRVVFGNTSWLTHRSLAMASFAGNVAVFGYTPFGFKLVNLLLHLVCGLVAYRLLTLLCRRDPSTSPNASLVASLIVLVWLLHPLNLSTVLYAVQRMTQLATLCCLLGMWLYMTVRVRMEAGTGQRGWWLLLVAIPALTLLGIQGKQNAVILPALCLVLELVYFGMPNTWNRQAKIFYGLLIALPAVLAVCVFAIRPEALLAGYSEYTFSPYQRLLSEARVLWDYIRMLLVPYSPAMGVYTDDYVASTSLFWPLSTVFALAGLLGVSVLAWRVRKGHPGILAGWCLFLAGHAVEGTLLPIELYYEHRNYLPAFGLFLSLAGVISILSGRLMASGIRMGRVGGAIAVALCLMLAVQTHGRARVWSDIYTLAESALAGHPDSTRAVVNYVGLAMESGDPRRAYEVLDQTISSSRDPKLRGLATLFRIRMHCQLEGKASSQDLIRAVELMPNHVDLTMVQIMGYTRHIVERDEGCEGISRSQFADALAATVDKAASQPDTAWAKWMLRYRAAALYAADGHWQAALEQANLAWQPTVPIQVSELLVDIHLALADVASAQRIYEEAQGRADLSQPQQARGLERQLARIERARRGESRNEPFAWDMDVQ